MHCTKCHDGKIAFAPKDVNGKNCNRCHTKKPRPNIDKFAALEKKLPKRIFKDQKGNKVVWIDWVRALDEGAIEPKASLSGIAHAAGIDRTLSLEAGKSGIPPAIFPHKVHEEWLDCSNCHPDIFNIRKKTTEHFSMDRILKGEFCGVCHLSIAFPLNDCARCHPGMQ
jgi:c(7)-type cytochrome triheme protein